MAKSVLLCIAHSKPCNLPHCFAAGPCIGDAHLTAVLANYWQHDALLQLLLHAVRVLMQHSPPAATPAATPTSKDSAPGTTHAIAAVDGGSVSTHPHAGAVHMDETKSECGEAIEEARRSVGLPELLDAVQDLSKVSRATYKGILALNQHDTPTEIPCNGFLLHIFTWVCSVPTTVY